jgi:hypothetical protein
VAPSDRPTTCLRRRWNLDAGTHSKIEWPSAFVPHHDRFSRGFKAFHALAIAGDLLVTGGENGVLFHDLGPGLVASS